MAWLEFFERFQGAIAACIAALIGFSGIIITIRANARIAQKEREDQRTHEKNSLIATLHGELITIKDIIDDNLRILDAMDDVFFTRSVTTTPFSMPPSASLDFLIRKL